MSRYDSEERGRANKHEPRDCSAASDIIIPYPELPDNDESTSLLPGKPQSSTVPRKENVKFVLLSAGVVLTFLFVFWNLYLHFANCPLYPSTMNDIRRGWEEEVAEHEVLREEWRLETQRYEQGVALRVSEEEHRQERVRRMWDREVLEHENEVARRDHEEKEREERIQREWALEEQKHKHECEEMQRREDERQEKERQKWQREVEDHDRIEEDRRKREEEERQKLRMFWGDVEAHTCTTYGTREYTAQLMNLPTSWEHRVEACKATPLEVRGIFYLPKSCEDKGPGIVIGRWDINQHEPDCVTYWVSYIDKGCTSPGSGKRRIEHHLENLPKGGDWREFCATTPARFHGLKFHGAQECFQYNFGTYGHWEIDDVNCQ